MLNKDNIRELAYVVKIDAIEPITGSDNCEAAVVGGWRVMVKKNTFKVGDLAIYFEIDSQVPATEQFAFLEKKHYKIKTQKYTFGGKGNFISQGLVMAAKDFKWTVNNFGGRDLIIDNKTNYHFVDDESRFLTQILGVTYATPEDNSRKAASDDKYKKMAQRHNKLFRKQPFHWLMKRDWGKKLLFIFFGRKRDGRNWPAWVQKTDEERVENMSWILSDKRNWIATEKIDGTSTTFTMKRGKYPWSKPEFYVCSRNVVFDKPDKQCFYDTNVYLEMAAKYDVENVLKDLLDRHKDWEWVTIQGETYGSGIQKRDYTTINHEFKAFNFITSTDGRWNSLAAADLLSAYHIPWVPILDIHYVLPDTVEELREFVHSENSRIDGFMKEGIVFRSHDGVMSFKCVDPEFLIKYHC